jgi:hypothetical protein
MLSRIMLVLRFAIPRFRSIFGEFPATRNPAPHDLDLGIIITVHLWFIAKFQLASVRVRNDGHCPNIQNICNSIPTENSSNIL